MTEAANLIGQHFGRLTVIRKHHKSNARKQALWECVCGCGSENVVIVPTTSLRKEITRSCGCLRKEATVARNNTHGLANTPEYGVWCRIKNRCYNEKEKSYPDYGGRGITMSSEWKESFEAFYHDMGPRPTAGYTVERRDNDKGYSKENCEWATRKEQANNRRTNIYYELGGESKTLQQWCEELDLKYITVYQRLRHGMSFEEAIQFIEYRAITFDETTLSLSEWCDLLSLDYGAAYLRLLRGELFSVIIHE